MKIYKISGDTGYMARNDRWKDMQREKMMNEVEKAPINPLKIQNVKNDEFGYCPKCGKRGINRDIGRNKDCCESGHIYRSEEAVNKGRQV